MASDCGTSVQVIINWLINVRSRKWRPAIAQAAALARPSDMLLEVSIRIFDDISCCNLNVVSSPLARRHHVPQSLQLSQTPLSPLSSATLLVDVDIADANDENRCEGRCSKRSRTA